MAEDLVKIGTFNNDAALIAAVEREFFKEGKIRIEMNIVTDSPTLLLNLISGRYDLILNNEDNVIAWADGQGADPQPNDFVGPRTRGPKLGPKRCTKRASVPDSASHRAAGSTWKGYGWSCNCARRRG